MSDTEDYMSDKFLQGIEKPASSSLIYRHADKRKFELMKKKIEIEAKLNQKNSIKLIEEEKREAGLSSAITSSNKGYEMIMKMGYKPGHGIGKTESGRTEHNKSMKDFRDRIAQKRTEQLLKTDLYKSQKVCQKLDMQQEIEKPREIWFWLPQDDEDDKDNSDTEEDDDSLSVDEKLEILTKYLREKYFYCIWCGVAFLDEDDLRDNCPGSTRNDH
ncbi:Coiled-coil domain-containing protein 75 [Melipona quadrifasciata]|uniref:G patch domain-containing protein 11 n=1 Tax=Melipona quadrifasciata TaxID=166423 RepID=A0A0N0BD30_9HYME|nr:Coiled-coil domain-containing protein 75 [Melipona quadrifasciata]